VTRVVQISFFTDPLGRSPETLLREWPSLVDVAEATAKAGVRVSVIQACPTVQTIERNGVDYHFLPYGHGVSRGKPPAAFRRLITQLMPDVCHVHGLAFPRDVLALSTLVAPIPIVMQDHANQPPRIWRRPLWRRAFAAVSGVAFCAVPQAQRFRDVRIMHPQASVYEIPESTSRFVPGERELARQITGLTGDPALLWVGHLDSNKDPLTVLEGVRAAAESLPDLELWCYFGRAPLLNEVQARLSTDDALRQRVHLMGHVAHARIEELMRAADLFVLGSHREGSGYSVIEALACALPPIVTDIPSYRVLTGNGAAGALWPCDDWRSLAAAIVTTARRPRQEVRALARAQFERELSFEALGRKLRDMYEDVLPQSARDAQGAR
jgi:glycosyltransferase involved in cell wall biosynthesis